MQSTNLFEQLPLGEHERSQSAVLPLLSVWLKKSSYLNLSRADLDPSEQRPATRYATLACEQGYAPVRQPGMTRLPFDHVTNPLPLDRSEPSVAPGRHRLTISSREGKLQLSHTGYETETVNDCRYAVVLLLARRRLAAQRDDIVSGARDRIPRTSGIGHDEETAITLCRRRFLRLLRALPPALDRTPGCRQQYAPIRDCRP